jgi:hypothetical protein
VRLEIGASSRFSDSDERNARTGHGSLSLTNPMKTGLQLSGTVRTFANTYSDGKQLSFRAARAITAQVSAVFDTGTNRYELVNQNTVVTYAWYRLSGDVNFSRHVSASVYGEIYDGDLVKSSGGGLEVGYRF